MESRESQSYAALGLQSQGPGDDDPHRRDTTTSHPSDKWDPEGEEASAEGGKNPTARSRSGGESPETNDLLSGSAD